MSSISGFFDVNKQLTFYGAYHSNPTNIAIHIACVPVLLWTFQAFSSEIPMPSFFPIIHHTFNDYMTFELNFPAVQCLLYFAYYFVLEPLSALMYAPQMALSLLTAISFSKHPDYLTTAVVLHALAWIAQFIGHGVAEKRAPALVDNVIGAVVLAPFFVHLELLFLLGYKPELNKQIQNGVGKEIARIKKIEGDKKRAAERKES